MRRIETRPFPVNRAAVIRCAFFALAKIGAKLHSYDEQTGILTATIPWKNLGSLEMFERTIEISVQEHEDTSMLKLVAPPEQSELLLRLISTYVVEGAQAIEEDAHIQWAGLLKKEEGRRLNRAKTQAWIDKLKHLVQEIPLIGSEGAKPEPPADVEPAPSEQAEIVTETSSASPFAIQGAETKAIVMLEPKTLDLALPHSPGMLITDRRGRVFEIQVDPRTTADRRRHLVVCPDPTCAATNLQGSSFCFRCGKQLTLGAASDEVKRRVMANAQSSLVYGALSLVPVALLMLIGTIQLILGSGVISLATIFSALSNSASSLTSALTRGLAASTLPVLIFAALPSFLLGRTAIAHADSALSDLTLNFLADKAGRKRAMLGRALGTVGMYAGISVFVLVLLSGYLRTGG
jgi:hypothetical protein